MRSSRELPTLAGGEDETRMHWKKTAGRLDSVQESNHLRALADGISRFQELLSELEGEYERVAQENHSLRLGKEDPRSSIHSGALSRDPTVSNHSVAVSRDPTLSNNSAALAREPCDVRLGDWCNGAPPQRIYRVGPGMRRSPLLEAPKDGPLEEENMGLDMEAYDEEMAAAGTDTGYATMNERTSSKRVSGLSTEQVNEEVIPPSIDPVPERSSARFSKTASTMSLNYANARMSVQQAFKSMGISATSESRWVINPEQSQFMHKWNNLTVVCLAYVAVFTPIHIAMFKTEMDPLFIFSCWVDLVFLVDLVLHFFMMYPKRTDYGFALEHRHGHIIRHYLRSWFCIDLVSVLPFDVLSLLSESEEGKTLKAVKVIRLMRLLKLARVLRASRVIRRIETRASISYGRLDLVKFFAILCMITHWLANLWALTLVLVDDSDGVPRWVDSFDEQEKNLEVKTKDSRWKLYFTCLYFTSYTITSVGYGDIGPVNIVETIVATVMIIVSGISWAVVLGQVCGIVANLGSDERQFRQTMDELNFMMQDRVIPVDLQHRLRSFFLSNKTAQRRSRYQKVIESMSPGLQGEVVMEVNRRWISKVTFLNTLLTEQRGTSDTGASAFVVEVSQRLTLVVHAQSEVFGEPHHLYILIRGLVTRYNRLHQSGSVWGIDFVLSDSTLQEPSRSFAMTYVELTTLSRESFIKLVDKHKERCPYLEHRIRRFCCWLALQRALLKEAKLRQLANQANAKVSVHSGRYTEQSGSEVDANSRVASKEAPPPGGDSRNPSKDVMPIRDI